MASTKLRKYNAIPRGDDKKAIDALTRIAETLTGATGDKLEKALTLRDLEALDLVTIQKGLNKQGSQFTNIIKVGDTVTEADFPAKPVNFGAVGTYSNILLSWDTPTYKGHSTTEIYRSDTNVLGEALFIASTISSLYGDPVGTNSSYYYWIRHVNINGDKGPYNDTSGVFAETAPDIDYLLEQLTNQLTTSHLANSLREEIEWISKPDGLIDRSIDARSDIKYIGIDTSLIRDSLQSSNKELLNLGSAIHDFRKGYEERVATGERLINAGFYIDPGSGLIISRANAYTDQSFTNAEILINGVDGRIDLAVERVEELEDKATLATSSIELLAGEIDLRATYSEVNTAVASGIASLIPKYSFQFNGDAEGFTGVSHNAGGWISSTAASPAVSPTISYVIEDYPTLRMLVRLQTAGTWNGEITAGSEVIPVPTPSVEDSWEIITVKATSTGTITSLTFDLGDADIDFIEIAKQGSNDLALEGLTARVTIAESSLSAIDGTYITGIITTWYNDGAVITSDVNTLINSFDATYSVSATLTDINSNGTIDKANVAQTWVSAADANIRDVVFAYNAEEGITNVSVDLDALSGRITSQVFAISGLEGDVYTTKQAALLQEYYLHLVRIGGDTGNAKLALADSQLRAYVDENGEAVAEQITELTAISSGNTAQLVEVNSAIANEAEVRLTSFTSLQGNIGDVDLRVDDVLSLSISPSSALATKFTTIEGVINDPVTGVAASSGLIDGILNLTVSPTSALLERFTSLESTVYDGGLPAWSAGISNLETALAYDAGAIAISATDVYVTVEGEQQGIQQYAEVVADAAVADSPVTALWTVKASIAGLTSGFGLYNDGVSTQFAVNANRFSVFDGATITPFFTVVTGSTDPDLPNGIYAKDAFISKAFIKTLTAETVNADYVNALDVDVVGKLTATGVDFNGGTFVVDTNGQVIAKNITIQDSLGNTILSSGGTINIDYSGLSGLPTLGSLASQNSLAYSALTGTKPPTNADQTATALTKSIIESKSGLSTTNYSTYINAAYINNLLVDQLIAANIYAENIVGDTASANSTIIGPLVINSSTEVKIMEVEIASTPYGRTVFLPCPWFVAYGSVDFVPMQVSLNVYSQSIGSSYLSTPSASQSILFVRGLYFSSFEFSFYVAANQSRKLKLTCKLDSGSEVTIKSQGYKASVIRESTQISFL
jgi:hypothetical protein